MLYNQVYRSQLLPDVVAALARGDIALPFHVERPWSTLPFPPALIPLWSEGDALVGYWKHWFTPRQPSFVRLVRNGRHFRVVPIEIARSIEQLAVLIEFEAELAGVRNYTNTTPLLWEVARLSSSDRSEVLRATADGNATMSSLLAHPRFSPDAPLGCYCDVPFVLLDEPYSAESYQARDYTGTFPTDFNLSLPLLLDSSEYDLGVYTNPLLGELASQIPWLISTEKETLRSRFDSLLGENDLRGAWMTVNSLGRSDEVSYCLFKLAEAARDDLLTLVAKSWREAQSQAEE